MSAGTFVIQGSVAIPPDVGVSPVPIPFNLQTFFDDAVAGEPLTLLSSGTYVVSLGTPPPAGLKLLLIKVDAQSPTSGSPAPVGVKINGSTVPIEVSPGGFAIVGSPNPVAGITSVSLVYTTDVRVHCAFAG